VVAFLHDDVVTIIELLARLVDASMYLTKVQLEQGSPIHFFAALVAAQRVEAVQCFFDLKAKKTFNNKKNREASNTFSCFYRFKALLRHREL
jgi:hypothetical protein